MISTFSQVRARVLALTDDPNAAVFTDPIILPSVQEALDALYGAMLQNQVKIDEVQVAGILLAPGVLSITPAQMGIEDYGQLVHMEERLFGSSEKFREVWEVNDLSQRDPVDKLLEFEWRTGAFWFIGATTMREIRLKYLTTVEAPTDFSGTTNLDNCLTFLSQYAAGRAHRRKGNWEEAAYYMSAAVGPRYDQGITGGELFRLIQPMVRALQNVTWARRPYSATRRQGIVRRAIPYVAAQPGIYGTSSTSGVPDMQFSTATGSITPLPDGVNATFYLANPVNSANVFVSGVRQTQAVDYGFGSNVVTFLAGSIPSTGDIITVDGWFATV